MCLLVSAGASGAGAAGIEEAIGIYAEFSRDPPVLVAAAMREEVDSLLAPLGLAFDWRSLGSASGQEVFLAVVVIRFWGDCGGSVLHRFGPQSLRFGSTHVTGEEILPFSDVDCDGVRGAAGRQLLLMGREDRERAFGRALGRVVAHELYHVLTKATHHGLTGIAKPQWSARDLTFEGFRFGEEDYRVLRRSVLSMLKQMAGLPNAQAPGLSAFVESGCTGCHGSRGQGTRWGPSLLRAGRSYDAEKLGKRLKDRRSAMYHRARDLHVPWLAGEPDSVREIAGFLNTLGE